MFIFYLEENYFEFIKTLMNTYMYGNFIFYSHCLLGDGNLPPHF